MTAFFTSDNHFEHANILKYCKRPFKDTIEMRETMIQRWNAKVKPGDTVYIVGDFAFADEATILSILDRLNGQKFLIYGNHDKPVKQSQAIRAKFVKCCDYLEISIADHKAEKGKQSIVLSHYAHLVWNKSHHGSWMIHGHSHGTLKYPFKAKIMDAGVDVHNFTPISYDEVKAIMDTRPIIEVDHH